MDLYQDKFEDLKKEKFSKTAYSKIKEFESVIVFLFNIINILSSFQNPISITQQNYQDVYLILVNMLNHLVF